MCVCVCVCVCVDYMLRAWKLRATSGIQRNKSTSMGSLLHADNIIIIQESEEDLQRSIFQLQDLVRQSSLTVSEEKTKTMVFKDRYQMCIRDRRRINLSTK